jgi:hypothetical protein
MKRFALLILTIIGTLALHATPKFEAGKSYHIVCYQFPQGCVTDGATAGANTPLYYHFPATANAEDMWIITTQYDSPSIVTIQNAKTGQYVTYDGVRQDSPELRRYICMTDEMDGNNSVWYLQENGNGYYCIRNWENFSQTWDVRVDSYCVGTYNNNGSGNSNQLFYFTDEQGKVVAERQANDTGNGFYVNTWLEADEYSLDNWTAVGGWQVNTGSGGSHYNYETGASLEASFIENWHDSSWGPLDDCLLQQEIQYLPAGQYTLQADIMATRQSYRGQPSQYGTGVQLFANESNVDVSSINDAPEYYLLDFTVDDSGQVTLGMQAQNTNANWLAIDNIYLIYHGTEEELIEGEKAKIRKELADLLTPEEIEALIKQAGNDFFNLEDVRHSAAHMTSDPLAKAARNITIGGSQLVFVGSLDYYLCTLPLKNFGTNYTATVSYELRDGYTNLRIGSREVKPDTEFTFNDVEGDSSYKLRFRKDDGTTIEKEVRFTSLPVVRISGDFYDDYQPGTITVYDPDAPQLTEQLSMKAKWRGGITNGSGKHKRNYHVKLLDDNGEKLEKKFFGLRNDNSWILESCQVDMSRIRNRVLTDLWNDYSVAPYYIDKESKARTGTRGRFVELILDDEYRGIYCMTENMDRKQMKLKKYDEDTKEVHGQLWKSKDWSYGVFMGHEPNSTSYPKRHPSKANNNNDYWEQYNVKYPQIEDVFPTDWSVLYDAVDFVCSTSNVDFKNRFSEFFDTPIVIDYYILMETILSTDNHGKNMFFACYDKQQDKKITLGVWDMDATCGQRWSDDYYHQSFLGPEQDYAKFITNYEHGDYNLFKRLRETDAEDFNMQVRLRYRDLRQGPLATESILNRFRTYLDEFKTCGAAQREYDKWSYDSDVAYRELNFDVEMAYLDDWFTRRMNYLDAVRFKIDELPPTAISEAVQHNPRTDYVYDLQGQKVGTYEHFDLLPAGIYIVNGRKLTKTK